MVRTLPLRPDPGSVVIVAAFSDRDLLIVLLGLVALVLVALVWRR